MTQTQIQTIAQAIKDHLINLSINNQLDGDLTLLDVTSLEKIIEEHSKEVITDSQLLKASMILYADEVSIEEQIKRIKTYASFAPENEDDLIDNVHGVTPSQASEYSYTCESFLDSIES